MSDTVFAKIIRGEIPAQKWYEDDKVLAFLDIHPVTPGHTLLIPKEPFETIDAIDDETFIHFMKVARQLSQTLKKTFSVDRVAMTVIGTDVPHAHLHLFPLHHGHEITLDHDLNAEPDFEALEDALAKIKQTK